MTVKLAAINRWLRRVGLVLVIVRYDDGTNALSLTTWKSFKRQIHELNPGRVIPDSLGQV